MPEIDRLRSHVDQLRKEQGISREKVSVSAQSIVEFCKSQDDPLVSGIAKRDNPFIKKSSCTIL